MRVFGKSILLLCVGVLVVGLVTAQQPPFGGGIGGVPSDPAALVRRADVKKELKITDEQLAKVDDAVLKALGDVLDADQLKRLSQIRLQGRIPQAFKDAKVQTALSLSGEQKENVNTILDEYTAALKELGGGFGGKGGGGKGGFGANIEKRAALKKESTEKITSVLTAAQRKTWRGMVGEEFKFETGFGGFGGKGTDPKKKKKNDL